MDGCVMSTTGRSTSRNGRPGDGSRLRRWSGWAYLYSGVGIGTLLLLWVVVARLEVVSELFVPRPSSVAEAFLQVSVDGYRGGTLLEHLARSMARLLTGFGLAAVTAIPLGLVMGFSTPLRRIIDPLIELYRPLPPLAYYTLLIVWLGIGEASKIALLFLAAVPPLVISAMAGVRAISAQRIESAYALGATRRQVLMHVAFPSCLPDIFTGLRVGVTCVKVLGYVLGCSVVGVPTLEIKAQNVDPAEEGAGAHVCPVQDARRGWVYATVFRSTGERWEDRTGVMAGPPDEVVQNVPEGTLVFGDGAEKFDDIFNADRFRRGGAELDNPTALWTARLGLRRVRAGDSADPMELVPRYYRPTAPEEQLQREADSTEKSAR